jgi:hypothetical protein
MPATVSNIVAAKINPKRNETLQDIISLSSNNVFFQIWFKMKMFVHQSNGPDPFGVLHETGRSR